MLILATAFAAGVYVADAEDASLEGVVAGTPWLVAAGSVCLLAGVAALARGRTWIPGALVLAGFVLSGVIAARLFEHRFPPQHVSRLEDYDVDLQDAIRLEGYLATSPLRTPNGEQFDLEVTGLEDRGRWLDLTGLVRLRMQTALEGVESPRLSYGERVRLLAALEKPRVYRNPGSFNFRRWIESIEDVSWMGTVKSPLLVEKLPGRGGSWLGYAIHGLRQRLLRGIDEIYPPWSVRGRHGAVLKAILLGDRSSLDTDTIENFRKTGLYHLLVISGSNVALLAMLLGAGLWFLRLGEFWRSSLVIVLLVGYAALVELGAPTIRATLMIVAYLVARLIYREHASSNSVGLAALVLLILRPTWLFESGFQLSFAAALLIVGLAGPILERTTEPFRRGLRSLYDTVLDSRVEPRVAQFRMDVRSLVSYLVRRIRLFHRYPSLAERAVTSPLRLILWTGEILLFSAIIQIGLFLPMAESFHRITLAGIGLNALAIPLMTLLLAVAAPTVALAALVPALAAWPARLVTPVMGGFLTLADLPHLPAWLSYRVPAPPDWLAWGFGLSLVIAALAFVRYRRVFWIAIATFAIFSVFVSGAPFHPRTSGGAMEITALECGSGNAFFVVLPDQKTLLVDTCARSRNFDLGATFAARRWDPGENLVSPYLWSRRIQAVDIVAVRGDASGDISSLRSLWGNFEIRELWYPASSRNPELLEFADKVQRRGVCVRTISAGDQISRGLASIQVLSPPAALAGEDVSSTPKAASLALRVVSGTSSLVVSDGSWDELESVTGPRGERLSTQILAIAAHGNRPPRISSALLGINPRTILVSGGEGEPALPDANLSEEFRARGITLRRTAVEGAVSVVLNDGSPGVESFRPSSRLRLPSLPAARPLILQLPAWNTGRWRLAHQTE